MTFAELDLSKISTEYLQILFRSTELHKYMDGMVTGTTNRKYIKFSELLSNVKIPLPSLEEQNELVDAYNAKVALATEQETAAITLQSEIEEYLLKELGVVNKNNKLTRGLQFISLKDLSIWGVERLKNKSSNAILKSSKYPNYRLENIVEINPNTNIKSLKGSDPMSFIPMECISDLEGEWVEKREGVKSKSSGYTKFQEGDLIWARITPCMQNGKSAIVKGLKNGIGYGSTEFHVIRGFRNDVSLSYIYTLLRLPMVLKNATTFFTGSAGQQRVPKSYLEDLIIPLPNMDKQNEIVKHINGLKGQIKEFRAQATGNRTEALKNFEQKIFK